MSNDNKIMGFTSNKYNKSELIKMGVAAMKTLTCRKVDVNNPHFINYHLHDLMTNSSVRVRDDEAYVIEMINHDTNPALGMMNILIFVTKMERDKFLLINPESFKTEENGKVVYEQLLLTYMN